MEVVILLIKEILEALVVENLFQFQLVQVLVLVLQVKEILVVVLITLNLDNKVQEAEAELALQEDLEVVIHLLVEPVEPEEI